MQDIFRSTLYKARLAPLQQHPAKHLGDTLQQHTAQLSITLVGGTLHPALCNSNLLLSTLQTFKVTPLPRRPENLSPRWCQRHSRPRFFVTPRLPVEVRTMALSYLWEDSPMGFAQSGCGQGWPCLVKMKLVFTESICLLGSFAFLPL